jgi:hypothetical protein
VSSDDETKQESDCEVLDRRLARQVRQPIKESAGPATGLDGLGEAPGCRLNGFRRLLNSFRGLSQHSWRINLIHSEICRPTWPCRNTRRKS